MPRGRPRGLHDPLHALRMLERVQHKYGTAYESQYVASDRQQVIEQNGGARLRELREKNYHTSNPQEYCEQEWQVVRYMLVGDPAQVARMGPSACDMPNEWPTNLVRHFEHHFAGSVQKLDVPRERVAKLKTPDARGDHRVSRRRLAGRRSENYGRSTQISAALPYAWEANAPGSA
jgi:hypothetical protein